MLLRTSLSCRAPSGMEAATKGDCVSNELSIRVPYISWAMGAMGAMGDGRWAMGAMGDGRWGRWVMGWDGWELRSFGPFLEAATKGVV